MVKFILKRKREKVWSEWVSMCKDSFSLFPSITSLAFMQMCQISIISLSGCSNIMISTKPTKWVIDKTIRTWINKETHPWFKCFWGVKLSIKECYQSRRFPRQSPLITSSLIRSLTKSNSTFLKYHVGSMYSRKYNCMWAKSYNQAQFWATLVNRVCL